MTPKTRALEREEELAGLAVRASACQLCPQLVESRSQVVFGAGNASAQLMFVGEAPGASEDREGVPFVGASGKLLDTLLEEIGLSRQEVFIANVLKCRPPENRDPRPDEVANCSPWLEAQLAVVEPALVVTLGNFATRLLRGDPAPIGKVRGRPEVVAVGSRSVRLYPLFHPAAALYRRPNLELLREDFARIPGLLELGPPDQPRDEPVTDKAVPEGEEEPAREAGDAPVPAEDERPGGQLGLF